jgi:hypothetical protein
MVDGRRFALNYFVVVRRLLSLRLDALTRLTLTLSKTPSSRLRDFRERPRILFDFRFASNNDDDETDDLYC